MCSSSRDDIQPVFDALDATLDRACELSFDALTTPELLRMAGRLEKMARRLPVPGHALINQLVQQATDDELGGKLSHALADRLRITRAEAKRRVAEAADLGPRRALTGERLAPRLPATAAAQRDGKAGAGHVAVIRRFCDQLPSWVDGETFECAEAHLARLATEYRPDQLREWAAAHGVAVADLGGTTHSAPFGIDIDGLPHGGRWSRPERDDDDGLGVRCELHHLLPGEH